MLGPNTQQKGLNSSQYNFEGVAVITNSYSD
jgi:hypothetical protein